MSQSLGQSSRVALKSANTDVHTATANDLNKAVKAIQWARTHPTTAGMGHSHAGATLHTHAHTSLRM